MKKIIIPSAPFKDFAEIEGLAMKATGEVKRIQIDVCDGKYVPSVSWPFTEFSKEDFEKLGKKDDFDAYLPFWENLSYSVDLMVEHPERYIETFAQYGIDEVLVHFRSLDLEKKGEAIWNSVIELVNNYELNLVLTLDVNTDVVDFLEFSEKWNKENVDENFKKINGFQVMGIKKIGFQGQKFDEESLEIVKALKKKFKNIPVYFDGGINEDTVEKVRDAGVDVFCVGSYLTKADSFEGNLQNLKKLIR